MKLTRRALFAFLPTSLLARWLPKEKPARKIMMYPGNYIVVEDEVIDKRSGSIKYVCSYWIIDGVATAPFMVAEVNR